MQLSKKISVTLFLSVIMFIFCTSSTAIKHKYLYGFDYFGWPFNFFTVKYDEGKIGDELLQLDSLLIDYGLWLAASTGLMVTIRLLRVKRKSVATTHKAGLEKIRLAYLESTEKKKHKHDYNYDPVI